MIKFKHKKHMQEGKGEARVVIYYNISDIFLGLVLLVLVFFFIHDYLSHRLGWNYTEDGPSIEMNQMGFPAR